MIIDEFSKIIQKIQNYYNKEYNDTQKQEIYKYFSKYNEKRFEYVISLVFQKQKFLPMLSDLIEIDRETPYKNIEKKEINNKEKCSICRNDGFVLYKKKIEGILYEFVSYCECSRGANYMFDGRKMKDSRNKSDYYIPSYKQILHI